MSGRKRKASRAALAKSSSTSKQKLLSTRDTENDAAAHHKKYLKVAIDEAKLGLKEGGIPIGSVINIISIFLFLILFFFIVHCL